MGKLLLIVSLAGGALWAQTTGPITPYPLFPADLQKYLELNATQVDAIRRANTELYVFNARKQVRMALVRREIEEWTQKDPIDSMQLGVRYAELETIRREMRDEAAKTTDTVRKVLNAAQLVKLKALEDAAKLQPLITDAVCYNLMSDSSGTTRTTTWVDTTTFTSTAGALLGVSPACVQAVISDTPLAPSQQP
jgi:hypothetical protein